jgi:PIN domain nuclease of toxin-antitoxin system
MNILLDSHILLWSISDFSKLTPSEKNGIENPLNKIYVSSASLWELHLKASKGKLTLPASIQPALEKLAYTFLAISWEHAEATRTLPAIHRDPFDRMLAAQAHHENLVFMTRDSLLKQYPITTFNS